MENEIQYGQMNFNLPHDVVPLPSQGLFYKNKKKSLKVGYLTAKDENLLMSSNSNNVINQLLKSKIYEPDFRIDEMLGGDIAKAFGDPFETMYLARNKPEELAKKLQDMTENMVLRYKTLIMVI